MDCAQFHGISGEYKDGSSKIRNLIVITSALKPLSVITSGNFENS